MNTNNRSQSSQPRPTTITMPWFAVTISDLRNDAFKNSSRSQWGDWLRLTAYCASQVNGGRIRNCKNWSAVTWIKNTGEEPPEPSLLWRWYRDDLIVEFYPDQMQAKFLKKVERMAGARGSRWPNKAPDTREHF